jgi:AraC-like DNA-binding protein
MNFDNFYIVLVFSGIILGLLSICILLFANKTHRHANRLLAFCTLLLVIGISVNALIKTDFFINHPHFFRASSPLLYMFVPCIYLYIRAVVKDETSFKKWDWLNFIPAFLHFCELLPFYILSTEAKRHFITTVLSDPSKLNKLASYMLSPYVHNIIKSILGVIYMLFALSLLVKNKTSISKRSPDQYRNTYRWLLTLASTVLIMYVFNLIFLFIPMNDALEINILMTITVSVIFFLCIYLFFVPSILFGLPIVRKELILNPAATNFSSHLGTAPTITVNENVLERKEVVSEQKKEQFNEAKYSYLEAYKPILEMHLESSKPYLKQNYSINDLSKETGIPLHHLTALLNKGYNERFNDFINKLRLDYLEKNFNPEWEKLTLEGIGNEVGFSSRTTFYNSIKKFRGVSPSEFFEKKKNQPTV